MIKTKTIAKGKCFGSPARQRDSLVNEIFARHQLATRKQSPSEDLSEFMLALKNLSKDCLFTDVTAKVYAEEYVRDAFITGLCSQSIRTRLLENTKLTLEQAFNQARSLELAAKHSEVYRLVLSSVGVTASVSKEPLVPTQNNQSADDDRSKDVNKGNPILAA